MGASIAQRRLYEIFDDILYIGCDDLDLDLFEGQYVIPDGVSYNSYLIADDKIAVVDSVDKAKVQRWLDNLDDALRGRTPDYLVISHMEPDHSAGVAAFAAKYPEAAIVGNNKTFDMFRAYYGVDLPLKRVVKEGDTLILGKHELVFYTAPMVHWPEVMVTYDKTSKVLFSADAFGKFGALANDDDDWACEARRYYFNIVGKYGAQVQALLKKLAPLEISTICPLHGPVLDENLGYYVGLYNVWSSYAAETKGTFIAYASVYGNTARAAKLLSDELENRGEKVVLTDLARCDMAEAVEDAFRYDKLVIAAPTLDGGIFPAAEEFIRHIKAKNFQNRKVAFIENGSWAPMSAKLMRAALEEQKNITFAEHTLTCRSSVPADAAETIAAMADELLAEKV